MTPPPYSTRERARLSLARQGAGPYRVSLSSVVSPEERSPRTIRPPSWREVDERAARTGRDHGSPSGFTFLSRSAEHHRPLPRFGQHRRLPPLCRSERGRSADGARLPCTARNRPRRHGPGPCCLRRDPRPRRGPEGAAARRQRRPLRARVEDHGPAGRWSWQWPVWERR